MWFTSDQLQLLYEIFLYAYFWPVINVDLKNVHFSFLWVKLKKKNGSLFSPHWFRALNNNKKKHSTWLKVSVFKAVPMNHWHTSVVLKASISVLVHCDIILLKLGWVNNLPKAS